MEDLIEKLKKLAERECWRDEEDFNPYEYSGGNFDDAYYGGFEDGEACLAKMVLEAIDKGAK
jgi:hypothetical protein